jgi:hypothetical protein
MKAKTYLLHITLIVLTLLLIMIIQPGLAQTAGNQGANQLQSTLGTAITYQGRLDSSGTPMDSNCDFQFSLWDAAGSGVPPVGGNQVGETQQVNALTVNAGLFAVQLDFGDEAFGGDARWLQTALRCPAGSGDYTILAPRQVLNAVPYAIFSQDLSLPFSGSVNSSQSGIDITNTGTGSAAHFFTDNPSSNSWTVLVRSNGSGSGLNSAHEGSGIAVDGYNSGTGPAGNFSIGNPANSSWALNAYTPGSGSAVHAVTDGSGWAGHFTAGGSGNGVYISSGGGSQGLNVVGGSKNAVVATSEGARLLYTEESSEVWFTDYGFGRLQNGSLFIPIDPLFAETVNMDLPYHVFVQPYGDAEVYVSQRTSTGFEVSLREGNPNVEFSYRLVASRLGYEGQRLERAPWADSDPNLYRQQTTAPEIGDGQ